MHNFFFQRMQRILLNVSLCFSLFKLAVFGRKVDKELPWASQVHTSTIIPTSKGHGTDETLSCNCRAVSVCSVVGKIIDMIILD